MNISNAMSANSLTQVQGERTKAKESNLAANASGLNHSPEKVSVSDSARVMSQISSLPTEQKAQVQHFLKDVQQHQGDSAVNVKNQLENAPKAIADIANKLNMKPQQVMAAAAKIPEKSAHSSQASTPAIKAYQALSEGDQMLTSRLQAPVSTNKSMAT